MEKRHCGRLGRREFMGVAAGSLAAFATPRSLRAAADQATRPNILWITIEDTSAYAFGCYGNKAVHTPNVDKLAEKGIQYLRAWSTGPQCSPARSTIITGSYASTYGMDIHRHRWPTPADMIMFPQLLRDAGYFCTNNSKTDYNTTADHRDCWYKSNSNASYNDPKRRPGQPFFAVFNSSATHMGRVRSFTLEGRRDFAAEGLDPAKLELPGHVPDLAAIRSDYAFHLEGVCDIDKWVGFFLADLEKRGLADDTIIFFYGDHGGCLPRGKGYLYETGLRVPLIVYAPEKWRRRLNQEPGQTERLVGFVDLAPTVLSLAGIEPPPQMQGRAFLGQHQAPPRELQFALRGNQAAHYDPIRAVTDGRWKYIRHYLPHKPGCLRNFYQWAMPANLAWDAYVLSGQCTKEEYLQPYRPRPTELLFDLDEDPWELNNLATQPEHADQLERLRSALSKHLRETADLGLFPRSARPEDAVLYDRVHNENYPLDELIEAAELASQGDPNQLPRLAKWLASDRPELRFWAAAGFVTVASRHGAVKYPPALAHAITDANPGVAAMAAEALCHLDRQDEAMPALLDQFAAGSSEAGASLETITWYPKQAQRLREHAPRLRELADENRSLALEARSILVNLGELSVAELYTRQEQKQAPKVNQNRRALVPLP